MINPWTDDEIATLRRLWPDHSASSISMHHLRGRSRHAIVGKADRLGLDKMGSHDRLEENRRKPVRRRKPSIGAIRAPRALSAAPEPPVAVQGPIAPVPSGPVTIHELRNPELPNGRKCRYILGPVKGLDTLYCGSPTQENSSYCPEHHARCHTARGAVAEGEGAAA